jgi:RNA polymerase sigma factor (sigma-70 family)
VTQAAPTRILSDAAIARRAAGGSQRAFTEIFERYHQDLYRYCVAILGNSEDANDAVQNTMLKVLRALPGEKRELKLKPWLYRVAHNEAIDMIRARRGSEEIDAETLAARGGPVEEVEARGRLQQLISDIAELPDRQRGALVMREMSGLSYAQIGEALQTSPAVARQTIYEARLGLQQMSEGREMSCEEVMRAISDDDGRVLRRRDIRAHLRRCDGCQAFRAEISNRRSEFASIAPLPAAASAAILHGLWGGAGGGTSAVGGAAGAAAGKAIAGSAAIKSAAAILAVSAVGVVAADRSGVIDLGVGVGSHPKAATKRVPAPAQPASSRAGSGQAATVGGARLASPRPGQVRRGLRKASAVGPAAHRPARQSSPGLATEPVPQSNGRHLGVPKASGHGKSPGKPGHPAKGAKGASATAPGHSKSPGKAKHAGGEKHAAESHPPHPEHPAGSGKSAAATPSPPEAVPPATTEAVSGEPGKPTGE